MYMITNKIFITDFKSTKLILKPDQNKNNDPEYYRFYDYKLTQSIH